MRTRARLEKLKEWTIRELCNGRSMKAPGGGMNLAEMRLTEPKCYLAWAPSRLDQSGRLFEALPESIAPGIIIMPNQSTVKNMKEIRFDRYSGIHRPQELGQTLNVSILFCVYEPGTRLPGFAESAEKNGKGMDLGLLQEGTETGLFTLMDWMDDCKEKLLGARIIPETDLFLDEASMTYSLYTDQSYVVDRRPMYYGFVNASFGCYAEERPNPDFEQYLE